MPSISYNGQSFLMDGRRIWILGAALTPARIPHESWRNRLRDVREAGFNTVSIPCPWSLHEARKGRYVFEGQADIARFVEMAAAEGLRVILRVGPFIGDGFDGGGIPSWLLKEPGIRLREKNEVFIDRMARYFRKLMAEVTPLLATKDGPIILVQIEQSWACGNDTAAVAYLGDIARILRECGVNVPLYNANNLWADPVGTIDSWQGSSDLLGNLRQLRVLQPDAPRLVSSFEIAPTVTWGESSPSATPPDEVLRRFASILAAGGQPVVSSFHGGSYVGMEGGTRPGGITVTTSGAVGAPVGEAGVRGPAWWALRRLALFAGQFEHLFADLDPEYQPVTLDLPYESGKKAGKSGTTLGLVPLRGGGGKIVFVFSNRIGGATTLLMQNGIRLPIDLGDQPVGWYVADLDLKGHGRLDYANLCPVGMAGKRIVVFQGPARMHAEFSIGGAPVDATVPSGKKPVVVEHKGLILVVCNQTQVDSLVFAGDAVYVGASGLNEDGEPITAEGWTKPYRIDSTDGMEAVTGVSGRIKRAAPSTRLADWSAADGTIYAGGSSPRFASLPGPQDLPSCGAMTGYGWYSMKLTMKSAKTLALLAPESSGRIHYYVDSELQTIAGDGPGCDGAPFTLKIGKGEHTIVALVDNVGRYCDGHDLDLPLGLRSHLHEVTAVANKPSVIEDHPVDPFAVRGFIFGSAHGAGSDPTQLEWTIKHLKKSTLLLHFENVALPGTIVLNGTPIAYHAGRTGSMRRTIVLDPADELFKRGVNTVRFAPELGHGGELKAALKGITLYESTGALTKDAQWAFAKWESPKDAAFSDTDVSDGNRTVPTWWRARFDRPNGTDPFWVETTGLSKGHILINGQQLGRYFTRTLKGAAVGPQQRLLIPASWLHAGENEILVFDEHGFAPHKMKISRGSAGDLD